ELNAELEAARGALEGAERESARIREELLRIEAAELESARLRERIAEMRELAGRSQRLEELARTHERRRALADEVREIGLELDRSEERLVRLERAPQLLGRY